MFITNIIRYCFVEKPVVSILFLVLVCAFFRVIDIFVLRLDEPPVNEIILSKTLGLLLLFFYLKIVHSSFGKIGFHSNHIFISIFISLIFVLLGLVIIYGSQFIYLQVKGAKPYLTFQHYTLLAILVSVIAGNIINALMEEGLFRGLMIAQFMNYTTFWKVNILQASIFGIWHIVWPLKDFYMGKIDSIGALVGVSAGNVIITFLMGLTMGYIFYKTGNLWAAFSWHFLMNLTQNILVIRSSNFSMESAIMNTSSTVIKGFSFILIFIITNICIKYLAPLK